MKTFSFQNIATPENLTLTPVSGGSLAPRTYYYRVFGTMGGSRDGWSGKSKLSEKVSVTTDGTNKSVKVEFDMPLGECGYYRVLRSTAVNFSTYSQLDYYPSEADVNVNGKVTIIDNGYGIASGNHRITEEYTGHGILTIGGGDVYDPLSAEDLYQESQANGWDIIEKLGDDTYKINTYLSVLGTTYWKDVAVTIIFADGLQVESNAEFRFGEISGSNLTSGGCNIVFCQQWFFSFSFEKLYAYRTAFTYKYPGNTGGAGIMQAGMRSGVLQDSTVDAIRGFGANPNCLFKNVIFSQFDNLLNSSTPVIEGMRCLRGSRVWQIGGGSNDVVARGVYIESSAVVLVINADYRSSLTLIDCEIRGAKMFGNYTGNNGFRYYEKFSFNLNVVEYGDITPIEGATVTMRNKDEEEFTATTDVNGDIPEKLISFIDGVAQHPDFIYTDKFPYELLISKEGYETYKGNFSQDYSLPLTKTVTLKKINDIRNDTDGGTYKALNAEKGSSSLMLKL